MLLLYFTNYKGELKMVRQITSTEISKLDKNLQGLEVNWLADELKHADTPENADTMATSKLPESNYKNLRVLRDIINRLKKGK